MIQIKNLTKKYGNHVALDDLNFTIDKGEIIGFLGPNGAGKSTAMNIITGYISATEGTVLIDDIDILEKPEAVKKKIGYLPEIPPLYSEMTVYEYLKFVCQLKRVKRDSIDPSLERIMSIVKVGHVRNRLIKNLSKGYKQRVGLAQALIGDPEVLILDEPTVGLDPKEIIEIRNLIKNVGKDKTVILSSHILSEISAVCDKVLIINKGKAVISGTPEQLSKKLSFSNKMLVRVKASKQSAIETIKAIEDVKIVKEYGVFEPNTVDLTIEAKEDADIREKVFNVLSEKSYPILMMKNMDMSLEDIFLQVTAGEKGEK
ncbi:ABC transporter ATP-binding protein [Clostridium oryzae]|uniref:Putative ABC transporter ATP-binding protein YxlF n=1 Tax=Clostridium oryzae TaxID=1450648 RepID=A0A1V4IGL5_9CLOT|nr:ATP-binding cassette domain-containing protein [Clostridium oryzae]OPJ58990.1 putative ABC transporter ATP-binding protein YxlF [Clostridium oryzae]